MRIKTHINITKMTDSEIKLLYNTIYTLTGYSIHTYNQIDEYIWTRILCDLEIYYNTLYTILMNKSISNKFFYNDDEDINTVMLINFREYNKLIDIG